MNQERIYLLTGTNLGDRFQMLQEAESGINHKIGPVLRCSGIYETEAWGVEDQPKFLNQVLEIRSLLEPHAVLEAALEIEREMGRMRYEKWGPRLIDIDLLFFGSRIIADTELSVPHPGIASRRFVLEPLAELIPDFEHPVLKHSIADLLHMCKDPLSVTPYAFDGDPV